MNFGEVLHTAQKNEQGKKEVKYYSTKFAPPKKEQRNNKTLSVNVQKFLARKEAEEKKKQLEAKKKLEQLLELRAKDTKAKRRVNVMLKRTKSASQAVIEDALDNDNTAVTLAGPCQPDEDDYGYVSQEAATFYNKMMEKYSKMPDEPKFPTEKKRVSTNLSSTKDRVKAALEREKEEAMLPHRRKRKHTENSETQKEEQVDNSSEVVERKEASKPKMKAAPPPLNFVELLKIAEKKQHEPIIIETKKEEEERPLTKKQKKEAEREREWRERKEKRINNDQIPPTNRIPKLNGATTPAEQNGALKKIPKKPDSKPIPQSQAAKPTEKNLPPARVEKESSKSANNSNNVVSKAAKISEKLLKQQPKQLPPVKSSADLVKPKQSQLSNPKQQKQPLTNDLKPKQVPPYKQPPPNDLKVKPTKQQMPPPNGVKPKEYPPRDLKPKQFPPPDVRRKEFPSKDVKRKPMVNNKRRIMYDDDEEYDSEMDDFIDDGPEDGSSDYSKYISEIFGYDKNKYKHVEDDVDNMESTFAQQMREEVISTKIGIMEDLEDMKMEEEAKKRKALMRKVK